MSIFKILYALINLHDSCPRQACNSPHFTPTIKQGGQMMLMPNLLTFFKMCSLPNHLMRKIS